MKLLDEDCGCDDDYFSIINNSPLLNGNQENNFNPSNNKIANQPLTKPIVFDKNSINNNINLIPKIESNLLNTTNNKINDNNIKMNNIQLDLTTMNQNSMNNGAMNNGTMNNAAMNNAAMNNAAMNNAAMNNAAMNNAAMNNAAMNNAAMNNHVMTNPNSLNSMNNINTAQELVYINENSNNNANNNSDKKYKNMITTINYIFMVVLALALNDVSKYYINRSIKFQNGTHKYYLYYILGLIIVVYLFSRLLNKLD